MNVNTFIELIKKELIKGEGKELTECELALLIKSISKSLEYEVNKMFKQSPKVTGLPYADWLLENIITNEDDKKKFIKLANEWICLNNSIINEKESMYDDWKYGRDDYDSITREHNLNEMEEDLIKLNTRAKIILTKTYNFETDREVFYY